MVIAAGTGTTTPVGTRGAVFLMDYCGECRSCRLGYTNQCLAKRADMGFTADGGYGPYELVHETNFFPVPDDITGAEATLLLDVMGTSGHAIGRVSAMRDGHRSRSTSPAPARSAWACWSMAKRALRRRTSRSTSPTSSRGAWSSRRRSAAIPVDRPRAERVPSRATSTSPSTPPARPRRAARARRPRQARRRWSASVTARRCTSTSPPTSSPPERAVHRQRVLPLRRDGRQPGAPPGQPRVLRQDHHSPLRRRRDRRGASTLFLAGETGKVVIDPGRSHERPAPARRRRRRRRLGRAARAHLRPRGPTPSWSAIVGRDARDAPSARAAAYGTTPLHRHRRDARRGPARPGHRLPAERGALRPRRCS